ncbi:MAG: FRG domain-containing protein [Bryobacteraceae bacterium]
MSDTEPLSSLQAVQAFLASLPPPAPGHVRLFRGQNRDFGKMLASGMRGARLIHERIWADCAMNLSIDLLSSEAKDAQPDLIQIFAFWVRALAQHYGPGSSYLDVTHSPEVALWFALNEMVEFEQEYVMGPAGPPSPDDVRGVRTWVQSRPWTQEPGWFYVLDVPKWSGESLPKRGEVVDLAEAPAVFAASRRMQAQAACLVMSGYELTAADLSDYYAIPPFRVAWPMADAPLASAAIDKIFPGPSEDAWYERFLSIPLVRQLDSKTGALVLAQPVPITFYAVTNPEEIEDRVVTLRPPFADQGLGGAAVAESVKIVIEAPLLFKTPPAENAAWNHGILAGDLPSTADSVDAATGSVTEATPLTNVLFEFSPLEVSGWWRVEKGPSQWDYLRAAWMVRESGRFIVHLIYHNFPGGLQVLGPFVVSFMPERGRFCVEKGQDPVQLQDVGDFGKLAKPFYTLLLLLRELSPEIKCAPFPVEMVQHEGEWEMVLPVRGAAARLVRAADGPGGQTRYVLRTPDLQEPFAGPSGNLGALRFRCAVPWSQIDADSIRASIAGNKWPAAVRQE